MPSNTIHFNDEEYGFLREVAEKEYPQADPRLQRHHKKISAFNRLIKDAAIKEACQLALKHKVKIPKRLKEETKK